jgi:ATP-dependent Lon protease
MTVSSSSFFNPYSLQNSSQNTKSALSFDTTISTKTNYPTASQSILQDTNTLPSTNQTNSNQDLASQANFIDQFAYAPNISAMFNAYLEKQKLNSSLDGKKDEIAQRLSSNGTDKKQADSYAQSSVEIYKRAMENQLNSKISEQVEQLKEYKQKVASSQSANPYLQIAGNLVNLYS